MALASTLRNAAVEADERAEAAEADAATLRAERDEYKRQADGYYNEAVDAYEKRNAFRAERDKAVEVLRRIALLDEAMGHEVTAKTGLDATGLAANFLAKHGGAGQ